jgi:hypothetical protein
MSDATPTPGDRAGWLKWHYANLLPMFEEWAAVWAKIPPDAQAEIRALHGKHYDECCAFSEGQTCCISYLDGSAAESYLDEIRKTEPVEVVRSPRRVTVVYRYGNGMHTATSPEIPGLEETSEDRTRLKEIIRLKLAAFLDPAVEIVERDDDYGIWMETGPSRES